MLYKWCELMDLGSVKNVGIKFNGRTPWTGFEVENTKKCIDKIPQNSDRPCRSAWHVDNESESSCDVVVWHRIKKQANILITVCNYSGPQTASVFIVIRLRAGQLRNRGSIPDWGNRYIFSTKRPGKFWGSPILLFNGYRGLFPPGGKATRAWN